VFVVGRFVRSRTGWVWAKSVRRVCPRCRAEVPEPRPSMWCVPVAEFTQELQRLQGSGDLIVVRHSDGTLEAVI
jgi:hypothetical protein